MKNKWLSRHSDGRHFHVGGKAHMPPKRFKPTSVMSRRLVHQLAKAKPATTDIGYSIDSIDVGSAKGDAIKFGKLVISKDSIKVLKDYAKDRGVKGKIIYMLPAEFLRRVPSTVTTEAPAFVQKKSLFHKESLSALRKAIRKRMPLNILMLDYTDMRAGYPAHDGRHRSVIAKEMGIKRVPVFVIGEPEVEITNGVRVVS